MPPAQPPTRVLKQNRPENPAAVQKCCAFTPCAAPTQPTANAVIPQLQQPRLLHPLQPLASCLFAEQRCPRQLLPRRGRHCAVISSACCVHVPPASKRCPPRRERRRGKLYCPLLYQRGSFAPSNRPAALPGAQRHAAQLPPASPGAYFMSRVMGTPRARLTSSSVFSWVRALMVARALFSMLRVPRRLDRQLRTPASSSTERTAPPAIQPVPSEAGTTTTLAECCLVSTCGRHQATGDEQAELHGRPNDIEGSLLHSKHAVNGMIGLAVSRLSHQRCWHVAAPQQLSC